MRAVVCGAAGAVMFAAVGYVVSMGVLIAGIAVERVVMHGRRYGR